MKNNPSKRLIKDSTLGLFRLHGFKNFGHFLHAYYYLSHIDQYVRILLPLLRGFLKWVPPSRAEAFRSLLAYVPDRYHAKVIRLEDARKLVSLDRDISIPPEASKKIIPFEIANQIIIRNPESIAVMDCACRTVSHKGCQPMNVCMMIGEPYASFVVEHARDMHPRRISQQEAVELLEECHQKGWVHNAYFKDVLGSQFYAICNCCSCCCGGIEVQKRLKTFPLEESIQELAPSGYLAVINRKKCDGCGTCVARCPFGAISLREERARVDPGVCMGCGVCPDFCPNEAIRLQTNARQGIPLDIRALIPGKEAQSSKGPTRRISSPHKAPNESVSKKTPSRKLARKAQMQGAPNPGVRNRGSGIRAQPLSLQDPQRVERVQQPGRKGRGLTPGT